jgi:hypothetical protein
VGFLLNFILRLSNATYGNLCKTTRNVINVVLVALVCIYFITTENNMGGVKMWDFYCCGDHKRNPIRCLVKSQRANKLNMNCAHPSSR